MPLRKGHGNTVISANIKEMLDDVKHGDGMIGNYRPPTLRKAQQVAAAIAYRKAGRSRRTKP